MATPLEPVIGVKRTARAATSLPLELMQHVFSYLDGKSFYAARKVCEYWRFASTDAVPLARQLRRMPIFPPVEAAASNVNELEKLYEEAARSLMISIKSDRRWDEPGSLTRASTMGFHISPLITATRSGNKTVTLYERNIALFDTSGEKSNCLVQRPNDLKETVGNGPWLKAQPNTYSEIALSSDGTLFAIAQERTIQIYDLTAGPDSFTVSEYISSATGHYICGLDFEHDDYVLRVRLSGKGAVLYLGTPHELGQPEEKASIEHWKSKRGLKHTFLDSSLLTTSLPSNEAEEVARLSGMQLLCPFEGGYLFAGLRHGGESGHYVLGHVKTSTWDNTAAPKVAPDSVVVLAQLESFLSSLQYTVESSNDGGLGLWENMPSAHEHHPRFAMTVEGCLIFVAERDKKRIRPAPLTQVFVYRIPEIGQIRATLAENQAARKARWATRASFLDKLDPPNQASKGDQTKAAPSKYTVPLLPLCLSTIHGDIEHLSIARLGTKAYAVSAATVETTRSWRLSEW